MLYQTFWPYDEPVGGGPNEPHQEGTDSGFDCEAPEYLYRDTTGVQQADHGGVEAMRERDIQAKVVGYARSHGVIARKLDFGEGWPDYMLLHTGRILFIEFKGAGGRVRPLQEHVHSILRKQGFTVLLIDDAMEGQLAVMKFIAQPVNSVVNYSDITKGLCK